MAEIYADIVIYIIFYCLDFTTINLMLKSYHEILDKLHLINKLGKVTFGIPDNLLLWKLIYDKLEIILTATTPQLALSYLENGEYIKTIKVDYEKFLLWGDYIINVDKNINYFYLNGEMVKTLNGYIFVSEQYLLLDILISFILYDGKLENRIELKGGKLYDDANTVVSTPDGFLIKTDSTIYKVINDRLENVKYTTFADIYITKLGSVTSWKKILFTPSGGEQRELHLDIGEYKFVEDATFCDNHLILTSFNNCKYIIDPFNDKIVETIKNCEKVACVNDKFIMFNDGKIYDKCGQYIKTIEHIGENKCCIFKGDYVIYHN